MFDPSTGQHHSIQPKSLQGAKGWSTVGVSRRVGGQVYAEFGTNLMRLDDETATIVASGPERPPLKLHDGREVVAFGRGTVSRKDPKTGEVTDRNFKDGGGGDQIVQLGVGRRTRLSAST